MPQPPRILWEREGAQAVPRASKEIHGDASSAGQLGWAALYPKTRLGRAQGQTPSQTSLGRQVQGRAAARMGS